MDCDHLYALDLLVPVKVDHRIFTRFEILLLVGDPPKGKDECTTGVLVVKGEGLGSKKCATCERKSIS